MTRHLRHTQENGKDRGLTFELGGNDVPKIEQGETSLSTTEAEIVALSMSMRQSLWSRRMAVDASTTLGSEIQNPVESKTEVFENQHHSFDIG